MYVRTEIPYVVPIFKLWGSKPLRKTRSHSLTHIIARLLSNSQVQGTGTSRSMHAHPLPLGLAVLAVLSFHSGRLRFWGIVLARAGLVIIVVIGWVLS